MVLIDGVPEIQWSQSSRHKIKVMNKMPQETGLSSEYRACMKYCKRRHKAILESVTHCISSINYRNRAVSVVGNFGCNQLYFCFL